MRRREIVQTSNSHIYR
jgi:hypothetical protein